MVELYLHPHTYLLRGAELIKHWDKFILPLILRVLSHGMDCLCGLVVRVSGYRSRGPGLDSQRFQIF
jgi:hypothetical protein